MKIQKILKRLLQLHPKSVDLSLDRIKRLLKTLNNPEQKIENTIQVVGTNGKHSVCSTLREIFETANYSVNMNISPSLRKFNERYYLSGKYISDDQLHDLLIEVEKVNKNPYRSEEEVIEARKRDPLKIHYDALISKTIATREELETISVEASEEIEKALEFARNSPYPEPDELFQDMWATPISEN